MSLLYAIAGMLAALTPARWWPWLDQYLPATRFALASSVATILIAGIVGIAGFIEFAQRQAAAVNDMVLSSPQAATASDDLSTLSLQGVSALSVFAFFVTPQGIGAAYLALSGLFRALTAAFAEPRGDPLLTAVDHAGCRLYQAASATVVSRARHAREGPFVPDRILRGVHVGLSADLVSVSSRRKRDWDQGTIVHSGDHWYRVGAIEERVIDGRLRTLYPLSVLRDHGAMRRQVTYEIPEKYARAAEDDVNDH